MPHELNLLPHKLAQFIRDAELTQWFSVPSVLKLMVNFNVVQHHDFPGLRRLLFAGEVLPTPTLIHLMQRLPHVRFTNLYGPTETTISSSHYTLPNCPIDDREPIPIGTACEGEELLILDEQMRPVPPSQIGELYIGGAGVAPGYWRDPEKTASAFVTRQDEQGGMAKLLYKTGDLAHRGADGMIYFHGRIDMQIKSRGHRIELGEIEAALRSLHGLRDAAVVAIPSPGFEGWLICCAFVPEPGDASSISGLRKRLTELLPSIMLPARWMRYESLPKNESGKTDRTGLTHAFQQAERRTTETQMTPSQDSIGTPPGETIASRIGTAAPRIAANSLGGIDN